MHVMVLLIVGVMGVGHLSNGDRIIWQNGPIHMTHTY